MELAALVAAMPIGYVAGRADKWSAAEARAERLEAILQRAGIALRFYAHDMLESYKEQQTNPEAWREYPFGADVERERVAAIAGKDGER